MRNWKKTLKDQVIIGTKHRNFFVDKRNLEDNLNLDIKQWGLSSPLSSLLLFAIMRFQYNEREFYEDISFVWDNKPTCRNKIKN